MTQSPNFFISRQKLQLAAADREPGYLEFFEENGIPVWIEGALKGYEVSPVVVEIARRCFKIGGGGGPAAAAEMAPINHPSGAEAVWSAVVEKLDRGQWPDIPESTALKEEQESAIANARSEGCSECNLDQIRSLYRAKLKSAWTQHFNSSLAS